MNQKLKKLMLLIVTVLTLTLVLTACKPEYTVKFDTLGGSSISSITVKRNALIKENEIPTPTKTDYTFAGWYKEKELKREWDFYSDKVAKNLTLYAKYVGIASAFAFTLTESGTGYSVSANAGTKLPTGLEIPAAYKGLPVTEITEKGFQSKTNVLSVTIPASVTTIGAYAFDKCYALSTVKFADNSVLSDIGEYAFCDDPLISSLEFPSSLKTIGNHAFTFSSSSSYASAARLTTVSFASGSILETIGEYAFQYASKLTAIGEKTSDGSIGALPSTLTHIKSYAFYRTSALSSINFGENPSLTTIDTYAFYSSGLTSVVLPKSLTSLGTDVFRECGKLKTVSYQDGLTALAAIPSNTFYNCYNLYSIELPESITSFSSSSFSSTKALKTVILHSKLSSLSQLSYLAEINGKVEKTVVIFVPNDYLAEYKSSNTLISRFIISQNYTPDTTAEAFSYIEQDLLVYVTKDTVNNILIKEYSVYFGTSDSVTLSDTIDVGEFHATADSVRIGTYAFAGSATLTSVTFPNSPYEIGSFAFLNCTKLSSVDLSYATLIDEGAFEGSAVETVTLGNSLAKIGDSAFQGATKLTSITIPASVVDIGHYAFKGCSALTTVNFVSGLKTIGVSAFQNDTKLTAIAFPNTVTDIGDFAFDHCTSLATLTLSTGLTVINNSTFAHCSSLLAISIPNSVVTIGNSAFYNCAKLTSLTFEAASVLTTIGDKAFQSVDSSSGSLYNTNLYTLELPASLTHVGEKAFYHVTFKAITINSIINERTILIDDVSTTVGDLTNLYLLDDNKYMDGRVFIINDTVGSALYDAYKLQEDAISYKNYKNNKFIVSKDEIIGSNRIEEDLGTGKTLIAYFGIENDLTLTYYTIGAYALAYSQIQGTVTIYNATGCVIKENAFESCTKIENIEFTDLLDNNIGTYSIGANAFKNCTSVVSATLRSVATVNLAFVGWTSVQHITVDRARCDSSKWVTNWHGGATVNYI